MKNRFSICCDAPIVDSLGINVCTECDAEAVNEPVPMPGFMPADAKPVEICDLCHMYKDGDCKCKELGANELLKRIAANHGSGSKEVYRARFSRAVDLLYKILDSYQGTYQGVYKEVYDFLEGVPVKDKK